MNLPAGHALEPPWDAVARARNRMNVDSHGSIDSAEPDQRTASTASAAPLAVSVARGDVGTAMVGRSPIGSIPDYCERIDLAVPSRDIQPNGPQPCCPRRTAGGRMRVHGISFVASVTGQRGAQRR